MWRSAGDFVTYVQTLAQGASTGFPAPDALRERLLELLSLVQKSERAPDVSQEEVEEARFALVAWADEVIQSARWSGREEWLREPLQMRLYRTTRAGDEFYVHLKRLGKHQVAAREVYFLVLALGFQGQLAGQDAERRALLAHQFEMLRATGRLLETPRESYLSPTAYELDVELPSRGSGGLGLGLTLLGVGLTIAYVVLWVVLGWIAPELPLVAGPGI